LWVINGSIQNVRHAFGRICYQRRWQEGGEKKQWYTKFVSRKDFRIDELQKVRE
jgi:hypothetical protein